MYTLTMSNFYSAMCLSIGMFSALQVSKLIKHGLHNIDDIPDTIQIVKVI